MTTNYTRYSKLSAVLLLLTYTTHRLIKITTHLVQINLTNGNVKFFKSVSTNTDQQLHTSTLNATQTKTSLAAVFVRSDKFSCSVIPTPTYGTVTWLTSIISTNHCACHDICKCELLTYLHCRPPTDWLFAFEPNNFGRLLETVRISPCVNYSFTNRVEIELNSLMNHTYCPYACPTTSQSSNGLNANNSSFKSQLTIIEQLSY